MRASRKAAVDAALTEDIAHIGALKRLTRAGMGGCQGRYCGTLLAEMVARNPARPPRALDEHAWFAPSVSVQADADRGDRGRLLEAIDREGR